MTIATATLVIGTDAAGQPVTLPPEVLTHTMAILAKKGAGKTYTAGVIEEEFAKAGLPFVVLDPVGVHYGIRSNRNGTRSAYSVVVFGGEHGDIPIERKMGAADALTAMEYLLGQDAYRGINRTSVALSGSDSGSTRSRWSKALQELAAASLATKGGTGRAEFKADARGYVAGELNAHGASDAEIDAVVQNVLSRLSRLGEKTT